MRPATFIIPGLHAQLAFYAFALTLPTVALKTFSWLSGIPLPASFYIVGAIISCFVFWSFLMLMSSVMSFTDKRT